MIEEVKTELMNGDITINQARIRMGLKPLQCFDMYKLPDQNENIQKFKTMITRFRNGLGY